MMVKIPSQLGSVEVPLTKDLLHGSNADKTMMNEYQIGSKFYEELVSRYPEFETLIIGIINPIDINVALNADNGEILFIAGRYKRIEGSRKYFDTTWFSINEVLIEEQEDNLILEIQKFINMFLKHWSNPEYINGNDLYVVAMLGVLYANIPNVIFNTRLGNCKTPRAHTFHIRQYLESFGQIGRYVDFVPIGTVLWLYKNVHYLEANAGKQKTFDLIMDNMLTPNEIPMSAYTARHELSNMSDEKPLPTSMLYKEVLNFSIVGASDDDRTVLDILEDQKDMARDNDKDLLEKEVNIQSSLDWGGDDRLNTKVLESEMIDIGEPYPFTLSQMLFNMWGYTVVKGYYVGTAYATNPLTGDRLSFNSKSAYIMAMYCLNKAIAGVELTRIPKIKLYGIPRTDQPDDQPSDTRFIKKPDIDKMMSWCVAGVTRRLKVLEIRGTHIPKFNAQDSEEFFDNVEEIYLERVRRYNTYCDVENLEERGDLELVAKRLYWLGFEETLLDMDYEQWFRTVGFDPTRFTNDDLLAIGLELVASATGVSEQDDVRKKWLQKSLLAILKHFISYTVHVIEKYTDGVVAYLEGQTLRYSNFQWTYIEPLQSYYNVAIDYKLQTYAKYKVRLDISNIFEATKVAVNTTSRAPLDLSNMGYEQTRHTLHVGTYALGTKVFNVEFNTEKQEPVYIIVIDDSINTIILTPLSGNTIDENFIYTMEPELSYIKPYDINAAIRDLNRITGSYDDSRDGIVIDGTFADVTDSPSGVGSSRRDSNGVLPQGMYGGSFDEAITDIGFVDNNGIATNAVRATLTDEEVVGGNLPDVTSVGLTNLSANLVDSSVLLDTADANAINISAMSIGFADPQIDPVDNTSDDVQVVIVDISGRSDDVVIDTRVSSNNALMINNINIVIDEDSIERTVGTDSQVAQVGSITASIDDDINPRTIEDSATVVISTMTLTVNDDAITKSDASDNVVLNNNIHASVVDYSSAATVDIDSVMINGISANVVDSSFATAINNTDDVIDIGTISGASDDVIQTTSEFDSTTTIIDSITLSSVDDDVIVANTIDNNSLIITNIDVNIDDGYTIEIVNDSDTTIITNITGNVVEPAITYHPDDNNIATIPPQLINVVMDEDDIEETLVDEQSMFVRPHNQISAKLVDASYADVSVDSDYTVLGNIRATVSDETTKVNYNDSSSVSVSNVHATVVDDRYEHKLNDNSVVNVTSINMQLNDSDIMLDGVDTTAVKITNIRMNLIDESQDS